MRGTSTRKTARRNGGGALPALGTRCPSAGLAPPCHQCRNVHVSLGGGLQWPTTGHCPSDRWPAVSEPGARASCLNGRMPVRTALATGLPPRVQVVEPGQYGADHGPFAFACYR
jgi:hypothetical protein